MARILLIKGVFLTPDNPSIVPPMGIMYLASYLRKKRKKDEIYILDLRLYHREKESKVREIVSSFAPHYVGISAITMEAGSLHQAAAWVKEVKPDAFVIAGGPHPSSYYEEVLADPHIDVVVRGEGEETFYQLLEHLDRNKSVPEELPGLVSRGRGGAIYVHPERKEIVPLDELPFPAWDLLELEKYFREKSMSIIGPRRYMTLFTSRACPYRCNYCHDMFGKTFRARSPENVLAEIELLVDKYGITNFEIIDDIFNLNYSRAYAIFELIVKRGLKCHFAFPNGVRSDLLDEAMLKIWRKGGTVNISFAIETASPRLQKLIRKNLKLDKAKAAIDCAASLGILCNGFFMLGFPTETLQEMQATIDFALSSRLHTALFFVVTPFKGTDLEKEWGYLSDMSHSAFEDYDYFRGNYNISPIPDEVFYREYRHAYRRFYLDPVRAFRIFKVHPLKRTLLQHGWSAFRKFLFHYRGNLTAAAPLSAPQSFFGS